MLSSLKFLLYVILAPLVASLPAAFPTEPDLVARAAISFNCGCIDHWFRHNRMWVRASATSGCMTLETIPNKIYALNAIPKPQYTSNDYPNLVCSLSRNACLWVYSPADYPSVWKDQADSSSSLTCESLDDAKLKVREEIADSEGEDLDDSDDSSDSDESDDAGLEDLAHSIGTEDGNAVEDASSGNDGGVDSANPADAGSVNDESTDLDVTAQV